MPKLLVGVIGVALALAWWVASVGDKTMPPPPQVAAVPPPPRAKPIRTQPCSPAVPCCPTAVQQLSGPPCRVGCAPAPQKLLDALPDLTTVSKPHPIGVVILELVINEKGVPVSSCVLRGIRADFDKAAQAATLGWRFEPKVLDGKPVGVVMTVTVKAPGINQEGR